MDLSIFSFYVTQLFLELTENVLYCMCRYEMTYIKIQDFGHIAQPELYSRTHMHVNTITTLSCTT